MARLHPTPANVSQPSPLPTPSGQIPRSLSPLAQRVAKIIDLIRPAVQADGGDIEFVELTPAPDNIVLIRMHGACIGCPSSAVTLQTGIERNLKEHIPEIRGVRACD